MGKQDEFLSTKEFAALTGQTVAAVTKQLRKGALKGVKQSGKWMISRDQAGQADATPAAGKPAPKPPAPGAPKKKPGAGSGKSLSIDEFSRKTYLTPPGVMDWLKKGLLTGRQSDGGDWQVDAANLDTERIKKLIR